MPTKRNRFQDYVSRIDNTSFRGYRVYLDREDAPLVRKYFSDSAYGSQLAACEAALAYRRSMEFSRPIGRVKDSRNKYGLVGVTLVYTVRPGGTRKTAWSWCASWYEEESRKAHKKRFSVVSYGYNTAYRAAVRVRLAHSTSAGNHLGRVPEPPEELVYYLEQVGRLEALLA